MTSFPHNLVLESQPRFGLTQSEFFKSRLLSYKLADFQKQCCNVTLSNPFLLNLKIINRNPISLNYSSLYRECGTESRFQIRKLVKSVQRFFFFNVIGLNIL